MSWDGERLRKDGIDPAQLQYAERILAGLTDMPSKPDTELTRTIHYIQERKVTTSKGRKKAAPAEAVGPQFVGKTPAALADQERRVTAMVIQHEENAQALAEQLGYEGSLTVGSLEDEIRFYQRRSVEAVLELGKRLLILRELTPHGEFSKRMEILGISQRLGQQFMAATAKFSNAKSTSLLKVGTQTKLLELLVLDDGEIAALDAGESARGLTLDEVEIMTVSELRTALREAKDDGKAKERLIAEKNAKLDALATKKGRVKTEAPDEAIAGLRSELNGFAYAIECRLAGEVLPAIRAILDHHTLHGGDSNEILDGALRQVERMTNTVRLECGLAAF